jgi:hypothetical protein
VDTETVDRQFSALQQQAQQTATLIQTLAGKLTTAAAAGDPDAREWALDLKEIALSIRDEQSTTTELLQAIHALVTTMSLPPSRLRRRTTRQPPSTRNRRNTNPNTNRSTSSPRHLAGRCSGSLAGGLARRSSPAQASASVTTLSTASSTDSELQRCSARRRIRDDGLAGYGCT